MSPPLGESHFGFSVCSSSWGFISFTIMIHVGASPREANVNASVMEFKANGFCIFIVIRSEGDYALQERRMFMSVAL